MIFSTEADSICDLKHPHTHEDDKKTPTDPTLKARLAELVGLVFDKRPILKEIVENFGDKNLYEYAKDYISVYVNPPIEERQTEFISTFKGEVQRLLGDEVADSAAEQLRKYYYVSTADHHGPICHPFFINSNLMASAPYFDHADPVLKNLIVLACANVSLNNSSFPRGLVFNSRQGDEVKMHRLSFLPSNSHSCAVYNFRAFTAGEVQKVKDQLKAKILAGEVSTEVVSKINVILDKVYNQPEIFACANFSDQITKTNYLLWKEFFAPSKVVAPNLIYLEQESLVIKLILDHHLENKTAIYHMMFDEKYYPLILQYFENINGTFSRENGTGTFLFWGISKDKNYRVQLWREDGYLVSSDKSFKVELTPEGIRAALDSKIIIPSMMTIFAVLCFYYGLKCLGGFSQVNYLTFMKNAYIKMQLDRGNYKSIEVCARAQTKELCGDLTIAFLQDPKGQLVPATGLDLILYGTENTWPELLAESKQLTLKEALYPMMPEFYRIIYPEKERKPELEEISAEMITEILGLGDKIKVCAKI